MTKYYDIHTHSINYGGNCIYSITNVRAGIDNDTCTFPFSYGIHPYDVENVHTDFDKVLNNNFLKAIGEIGLDFRFQGSAKRQIEYFKMQLDIAKKHHLPVILHIVKSLPQVLDILRKKEFDLPFIVHGFRGTIKQAVNITEAGGFISLSPKYPACTKELYNLFRNNLLLETDESCDNIRNHYSNIASICEEEFDEFQKTIEKNFKATGIEL